jgi:CRISPR-associated protein Cas8c/Csd1 subtype I-C
MLRELNELGTHFELSPLGYTEAIAHWRIEISTGSIIRLETPKKGDKLEPGKKLLLPDLRRNADEPLLIDDGGEYVFGAGERGEKRHLLYLELLDRCISETDDEVAKQVRAYLNSCNLEELDRQLSELVPPKTKRDGTLEERERFWWVRDRFVFTLDGERVTKRPALLGWWSSYYASKQDVQEGTCLLTGEKTLTVGRKMPMMVKGVRGTTSSGAALTSFDKAAYQSWGWDGNANAPIGFEAAVRLHKMLDVLIHNPQNHVQLGGQTFVFWGDQDGEGLNPEFWEDPAAVTASSIFTSPNRPSDLPGNRAMSRQFYLAVLKGNRGRIALSCWDTTTPEQIKTSIKQFVECQQFAEKLRAKPVWILRNCAFLDPNKEHTDKIASALVQAALFGKALPDEYAIRVINRICLEQDVLRSPDRAQALALYITTTMQTLPTVPPADNRLKPEQVAYILGRIAFLMHWAQVTAQNLKREETNVSRSLRALSTTPAQMFPRLYYGCIANHLEDRDGSKQLGYIKHCLNQEFAKFGSEFDPSRDLPDTFEVKAQACFFMGWGIRRAEFFQKKEKDNNTDD